MKTLSSKFVYQNPIFSMYTDELEFDDETVSSRTYLKHPGSVANLVIDDNNNVLLIKQYRHPLGKEMVELPAGIIDTTDNTKEDAAIRELQEETGLKAYSTYFLTKFNNSPGYTDETTYIFLVQVKDWAEDYSAFVKENEEASLKVFKEPLTEVLAKVQKGDYTNAALVIAILNYCSTIKRMVYSTNNDRPYIIQQLNKLPNTRAVVGYVPNTIDVNGNKLISLGSTVTITKQGLVNKEE